MFLTNSLLTKSSFIGSLLNKCRPSIPVVAFSRTSEGSKTIEEQIGLPPRPKKPLTPYFRFLQDMRPKVTAENPNLKALEVVRMISKKWETADSNLKQRLQEEYKKDQQHYLEIRTKYDSKITDKQRSEIKQLKQDKAAAKGRKLMRQRIKQLERPKRPASGFLRFIAKEREINPPSTNQTYRDWHSKSTKKWLELSDSEKEVFLKEGRADFEKYNKLILEWEEKMMRSGNIDVVRQSNLVENGEPKPRVKKAKI